MKLYNSAKRFWVAMLCIVFSMSIGAQISVLNESFAGAIPSPGWTMESDGWQITDGAAIYWAYADGDVSRLITPAMNVAKLKNEPQLTFSYDLRTVNETCDSLAVKYRLTAAGEWKTLAEYRAEATNKQVVLPLTETSETMQIAFEAHNFAHERSLEIRNIKVANKPECQVDVQNLASSDISPNGFTLTWLAIESDSLQGYNVKVSTVEMSDFSKTANTFDQLLGDEWLTLENLLPNTTYFCYVQYECGFGDCSDWAKIVVTTECEKVGSTLPYSNGFENGASSCYGHFYSQETTNVSAYSSIDGSYTHSGSQAVRLYSPKGSESYFVLPELDQATLSNLQVSFYAASREIASGYRPTFELGVMTTTDLASFQKVSEVTLPTAMSWEKVTLSLKNYSGNGRRIALKIGSANYATRLFFDDLVIATQEACPTPMFLSASNIRANNVTLAWTESGGSTEWNYAITNHKIADLDEADESDFVAIGNATQQTIEIGELQPNTTYYAYVQSGCDNAIWTDACEFRTAKLLTLPYANHFDEYDRTQYDSKQIPADFLAGIRKHSDDSEFSSTSYGTQLVTTENHETTAYSRGSLKLTGTKTSGPYLILPKMTEQVQNLTINFWAKNDKAIKLEIGIIRDQRKDYAVGEMFTESAGNYKIIETLALNTTNEWKRQSVLLQAAGAFDGYIVIRTPNDLENDPTFYIDDIEIMVTPICSSVTNLVAQPKANSITVNWQERGNSTKWNVKISKTAVTNFETATFEQELTANETTIEITGLEMLTQYFVYVQPACGADWVETTATTTCTFSVPYYNDFSGETTGTSSQPKGWTKGNLGGTTSNSYKPYVNSSSWSVATGYTKPVEIASSNKSLYLNATYSSSTKNAYQPYIIMPVLENGNVRDLVLSFWGFANQSSITYGRWCDIGVLEDPNDMATYQQVATVTLDTVKVPQYFTIDMSSYTGNGKYIVFTNSVAHPSGSTVYNQFMLTNLSILSKNSPCRVSDVQAVAATTNGVVLSWHENGVATQWQVKIARENAAPNAVDALETLAENVANTTSNVAINSANLKPGQTYYAYVRSKQGSDFGQWSIGLRFVTECEAAVAVPYFNNFNSYEEDKKLPTYTTNYLHCFEQLSNKVKAGTGTSSCTSNVPMVTKCYTSTSAPSITSSTFYDHTSGISDPTAKNIYFYATGSKITDAVGDSVTNGMLVLPTFDRPVNQLQVEFYAVGNSLGSYPMAFQVGVLDGEEFTPIETINETDAANNNKWHEIIVRFDSYAKTTGRIAIRSDYYPDKKTKKFFIDDLTVREIQVCSKVNNNTISFFEIGENSAKAKWTAAAEETAWNVKVSTTPITDFGATADVFDGQVTNPKITLNELTNDTEYFIYVQTVDSEKACTGDWSNRMSFTTLCSALPLPFADGFESINKNESPACYYVSGAESAATAFYYYETNNCTAIEGKKRMYFKQTNKDQTNYIAFPKLDVEDISKVQITYQAFKTLNDNVPYEIGVMTDPLDPSTFIKVATDTLKEVKVWSLRYFSMENYAGDNEGEKGKYIAFHTLNAYKPATGAISSSNWFIDDVRIDVKQEFAKPFEVKVDSLEKDLCRVVWSKIGATHEQWQLQLEKWDNNSNWEFVRNQNANEPRSTLQNLLPNTLYRLSIQNGNESGHGDWSDPLTFRTLCDTIQALPYIENFDKQTSGSTPTGWTKKSTASAGNGKIGSTYAVKGYSATIATGDNYAILPKFDVDSIKHLFIYFDANTSAANANLSLLALNDVDSEGTLLGAITVSKLFQTYAFDLSGYESQNQDIYLAFKSETSSVYIDNLVVTTKENLCVEPRDVIRELPQNGSIQLSWKDINIEKNSYVVEYGLAGFELGTGSRIETDTNFVAIGDLEPNSAYDLYIGCSCNENKWSNVLQANTPSQLVEVPYSTNFDDDGDNAKWIVENNDKHNKWHFGTAIDGDKMLYITNDDGTTYGYNTKLADGTICTSSVTARRSIRIENPAKYAFTFEYKAPANTNTTDYFRAMLLPAGYKFNNSDFITYDGTKTAVIKSERSEYELVKTLHVDDFETATFLVDVKHAGIYDIVLLWYNAATGEAIAPAAIRRLEITTDPCSSVDPSSIKFTELGTHSVALNWTSGLTKKYQVVISKVAFAGMPNLMNEADKIVDQTFEGEPTFRFDNLKPNTDYSLYVRSICEPNEPQAWVEVPFRTDCENLSLPYIEHFDVAGVIPSCWEVSSVDFITRRTFVYADTEDTISSLTFPSNSYAILPQFDTPINEVEIQFGLYTQIFNSDPDIQFEIGTVDETFDMKSYKRLNTAVYDVHFSSISSADKQVERREYAMRLTKYNTGRYLVLRNTSGKPIDLDFVSIKHLEGCINPQGFEAFAPTATSVRLAWQGETETQWELAFATSQCNAEQLTAENPEVDKLMTVDRNDTVISGLKQGTTYFAYVRAICSETENSTWEGPVSFTTLCATHELPLFVDFDNWSAEKLFLPNCWEQRRGLIGGEYMPLLANSSVYNGYRVFVNNNYDSPRLVCSPSKASNETGAASARWLVSPTYAVNGKLALSFDLGYIKLSGVGDELRTLYPEFKVLISENDGENWTELQHYDLNEYKEMTPEFIELDNYNGKEIRLALYLNEVSNSTINNYLQVDNLRIACTEEVNVSDYACPGVDYQGYGFEVAANELTETLKLNRFATSANGLTCDSIINLTLLLAHADTTTLTETICEGESFEFGDRQITSAGSYSRHTINQFGCDSLIRLTLNVTPNKRDTTVVAMCQGDFFEFGGKTFTESTTYDYRHSSDDGSCFTVTTLELTVNAWAYILASSDTIAFEQLPYQNEHFTLVDDVESGLYRDTVYDPTTCAASIYELVVLEPETALGTIDFEPFTLYPNPVNADASVKVAYQFDAAEQDGLVVEVFNAIGQLVRHDKPTTFPIVIENLNTAGLYTVRITTGKRQTLIGKLVVK